MKKFQNTVFLSDFDGTFADSRGENVPRNIEAIRYYISEGGRFTICTGRTFQGFHKYDPDYINAPVVLANGAMGYDYAEKRVVFLDGIGPEGLPAVRALRDRFPALAIEMYAFGQSYSIHGNAVSEAHFTNQGIRFTPVEDPAETTLPWVKVMLECGDDTATVQRFLGSVTDDPWYLPTRGNFVEVLRRGVNKAHGALRLAEALGVPRTGVFAAGDGYNDLDLLQAAAVAFVPANGSERTKQHATHITCSNDEGCIADAIEIMDRLYGKDDTNHEQ